MKKVGISGANGRMGRLTIAAVDADPKLTIHALYAPGREGTAIHGYTMSADPSVLDDCDIILEVTHPDATDQNIPLWKQYGADVVIGTSGFDTSRVEALRADWENAEQRCLLVPNFSVGAVLMMRFAEIAAPFFESSEIVEMHHHDKPDAPSGTSLQTARRMAAARTHSQHDRGDEISEGALGAKVDGIPVHSLRVHGSLAHQEVIFGTTGQVLTIRHDTTDYDAFSDGVLLALHKVASLKPGLTVGIDTLLDL